jgi:hypothetical protein
MADRSGSDSDARAVPAAQTDGGPGVSRRRLLSGTGALAGGTVLLATAGLVAVPEAAGATGSSTGDPTATTVAEFVAVIDQNGRALTAYGYLTRIAGLAPQVLFSDLSNPSDTTALFTAFATGRIVQRAVVPDVNPVVTALDVTGEMDFYQRAKPGADFSDPASFKVGRTVARYSLVLQDVLTVIAPNTGVPTLSGDMTQIDAYGLSYGGLFGQAGQNLRLSATGLGTRSVPSPPVAKLTIAGNLVGV